MYCYDTKWNKYWSPPENKKKYTTPQILHYTWLHNFLCLYYINMNCSMKWNGEEIKIFENKFLVIFEYGWISGYFLLVMIMELD